MSAPPPLRPRRRAQPLRAVARQQAAVPVKDSEHQGAALASEDLPPALLHGLVEAAGVRPSSRHGGLVLDLRDDPGHEEEKAEGVVVHCAQGGAGEREEATPSLEEPGLVLDDLGLDRVSHRVA
eukprot:CAMPEP_0180408542 /NCGR_PEP_ID=MMETSP0989-20121125/42327_1 /TAXON_ID=697907 /ORGANISM="non described non described, Strain CCMP2293" /LENGTH=123 /DNA_ID=CAMNT_0022412477 /DNA_START=94 /DNA_END=466 /DNA_ORIENTATION=+